MLDQASRLADGLIAWEYHTGGIPPPGSKKEGRVSKKPTTACRTKGAYPDACHQRCAVPAMGGRVFRGGGPLPKKSVRLTALRFAWGV